MQAYLQLSSPKACDSAKKEDDTAQLLSCLQVGEVLPSYRRAGVSWCYAIPSTYLSTDLSSSICLTAHLFICLFVNMSLDSKMNCLQYEHLVRNFLQKWADIRVMHSPKDVEPKSCFFSGLKCSNLTPRRRPGTTSYLLQQWNGIFKTKTSITVTGEKSAAELHCASQESCVHPGCYLLFVGL